MTTIPDKEVVRVLNESLIPLTAREIAINLGYPDPNNAVMCIMRRKLVSLRKYNMVTLAGFSKRDLGGPLTKTWTTPERIQDEGEDLDVYIRYNKETVRAKSYRGLCQQMVNRNFFPKTPISVYDYKTDEEVTQIQYGFQNNVCVYKKRIERFETFREKKIATIPEFTKKVLVPETESKEGYHVPSHFITVTIPEHTQEYDTERTNIERTEEWVVVPRCDKLKPNTPESKFPQYKKNDIRN